MLVKTLVIGYNYSHHLHTYSLFLVIISNATALNVIGVQKVIRVLIHKRKGDDNVKSGRLRLVVIVMLRSHANPLYQRERSRNITLLSGAKPSLDLFQICVFRKYFFSQKF